MIEVSKRRLLVDGRPRIVLAGELHYFRVPRAEWEQRLGQVRFGPPAGDVLEVEWNGSRPTLPMVRGPIADHG
jgi:hypothetical protein